MQNHSYENVFALHENETACRTHFHVKGFALRLLLKQRHKRTRKLPIYKLEKMLIMLMYLKRNNVRIVRIVLDLQDVTVGSKKVVLFEYEMPLLS